MRARERVEAALNFEKIDRIPFDATLTIGACNKLIDYMGLPVKKMDSCNIFQLCFPEPEVLKALGIDCAYLPVNVPSNVKPYRYGEEEHVTEFGLLYKKAISGEYEDMQIVNAPLADYELEDLDNYPWPDPNDDAIYAGLRERAKYLYENTDLALVGYFGGSMFTLASQLRGMEQWMFDLAAEPEFAVALMTRLKEYFITLYCRCLDECGEYLSFIRTDYDDFGAQNAGLISIKMYRELVRPVTDEFYHVVREKFLSKNPNGKMMKHCCGDAYSFIGDFIDAGIDMLDPVQTNAKDMDFETLARVFRGKIAFHAGIDTQKILPTLTPEDVQAEAKRAIETLAMPGGYIMGPVHHLQPDVPPENFIALRDAVTKYGTFDKNL